MRQIGVGTGWQGQGAMSRISWRSQCSPGPAAWACRRLLPIRLRVAASSASLLLLLLVAHCLCLPALASDSGGDGVSLSSNNLAALVLSLLLLLLSLVLLALAVRGLLRHAAGEEQDGRAGSGKQVATPMVETGQQPTHTQRGQAHAHAQVQERDASATTGMRSARTPVLPPASRLAPQDSMEAGSPPSLALPLPPSASPPPAAASTAAAVSRQLGVLSERHGGGGGQNRSPDDLSRRLVASDSVRGSPRRSQSMQGTHMEPPPLTSSRRAQKGGTSGESTQHFVIAAADPPLSSRQGGGRASRQRDSIGQPRMLPPSPHIGGRSSRHVSAASVGGVPSLPLHAMVADHGPLPSIVPAGRVGASAHAHARTHSRTGISTLPSRVSVRSVQVGAMRTGTFSKGMGAGAGGGGADAIPEFEDEDGQVAAVMATPVSPKSDPNVTLDVVSAAHVCPLRMLRRRLGTLLRLCFVLATFFSATTCAAVVVVNLLRVHPALDEAGRQRHGSLQMDGGGGSEAACVGFVKLAGGAFVITKACGYAFFFLKQRLVRVRPVLRRHASTSAATAAATAAASGGGGDGGGEGTGCALSLMEKLGLALTVAILPFAGLVMWQMTGDASADDSSCQMWVPLYLNVIMILADLALSLVFLYLFVAPLREMIRINREARVRSSLSVQAGPTPLSPASTPPAAVASFPRDPTTANHALERVMRLNTRTCVGSIISLTLTMLFMIVAHVLVEDVNGLSKHIGTAGAADLAFTNLMLALLMMRTTSRTSKLGKAPSHKPGAKVAEAAGVAAMDASHMPALQRVAETGAEGDEGVTAPSDARRQWQEAQQALQALGTSSLRFAPPSRREPSPGEHSRTMGSDLSAHLTNSSPDAQSRLLPPLPRPMAHGRTGSEGSIRHHAQVPSLHLQGVSAATAEAMIASPGHLARALSRFQPRSRPSGSVSPGTSASARIDPLQPPHSAKLPSVRSPGSLSPAMGSVNGSSSGGGATTARPSPSQHFGRRLAPDGTLAAATGRMQTSPQSARGPPASLTPTLSARGISGSASGGASFRRVRAESLFPEVEDLPLFLDPVQWPHRRGISDGGTRATGAQQQQPQTSLHHHHHSTSLLPLPESSPTPPIPSVVQALVRLHRLTPSSITGAASSSSSSSHRMSAQSTVSVVSRDLSRPSSLLGPGLGPGLGPVSPNPIPSSSGSCSSASLATTVAMSPSFAPISELQVAACSQQQEHDAAGHARASSTASLSSSSAALRQSGVSASSASSTSACPPPSESWAPLQLQALGPAPAPAPALGTGTGTGTTAPLSDSNSPVPASGEGSNGVHVRLADKRADSGGGRPASDPDAPVAVQATKQQLS